MRVKAFTLIELLIVVAIIAILAAIAVPNFLEAQVRSKVSRTKADMRSIATALESYRVDSNKYPPFDLDPQSFSVPSNGNPAAPAPGNTSTADPCLRSGGGLTTPISYMTSIPADPFGDALPDDLFTFGGAATVAEAYYYNTKDWFDCRNFAWTIYTDDPSETPTNPAQWVLQSKGPDKWFAPPNSVAAGTGVAHVDRAVYYQYDATNGTVSIGNIVRVGP
ncbi:MAG: prepilin-type N-terminal cleavage/methylation domain-containing protein [Sumerlaeia bacterium]